MKILPQVVVLSCVIYQHHIKKDSVSHRAALTFTSTYIAALIYYNTHSHEQHSGLVVNTVVSQQVQTTAKEFKGCNRLHFKYPENGSSRNVNVI